MKRQKKVILPTEVKNAYEIENLKEDVIDIKKDLTEIKTDIKSLIGKRAEMGIHRGLIFMIIAAIVGLAVRGQM